MSRITIIRYAQSQYWDRHGCDRMVVGFTTTHAICAYHHWFCEFESYLGRGAQHYVIKFVSDLQQVGQVFSGHSISSTDNADRHDITEIFLKMALNTIKPTKPIKANILGQNFAIQCTCISILYEDVFWCYLLLRQKYVVT